MMETILIKYHDKDMVRAEHIKKGNWIDLRAAETVELNTGDFAIIPLGVSMALPHGYEAHLAPRSSTFKNWGVLQTNSVGVIDDTYCGDNDIWGMPVYATRNTVIKKGDRICQFRIMPIMDEVDLVEIDYLCDKDRGGFGTTGIH